MHDTAPNSDQEDGGGASETEALSPERVGVANEMEICTEQPQPTGGAALPSNSSNDLPSTSAAENSARDTNTVSQNEPA